MLGNAIIPAVSLQTRLYKRDRHIKELEVLKVNHAVEISKLKEEFKRLKDKLKSHDQGIETLMAERTDLVHQIMH